MKLLYFRQDMRLYNSLAHSKDKMFPFHVQELSSSRLARFNSLLSFFSFRLGRFSRFRSSFFVLCPFFDFAFFFSFRLSLDDRDEESEEKGGANKSCPFSNVN